MRLFLAIMVSICVLFGVPNAQAQENLKIAIVDVLALQSDSKAAKNVRSQVEKLRKSYISEFKNKEENLKKKEKDLVSEREKIGEEAFVKKAKEFQKEIVKSSQDLQKRQAELDKAVNEALAKLRSEIIKVVDEISQENEYTLVFPRQSTFYFEKSFNITDEVMKRLDKRVSSIKVNAK